VAVCRRQTLLPEDLPAEIQEPAATRAAAPAASVLRVSDREVEELREALEAHRWRRDEAARALGISRTTLWRRMREAGLMG
jgi:transcriptional regulator of acetoin/glycerol metabolism